MKKTTKKIQELADKYTSFKIVTDVKLMGAYLYNADVVITSNSSTVYDSVSLGTLTIAVDKVKDEMVHLFSRLSGAVLYLGYHKNFSKKQFQNGLKWISHDIPTKTIMHNYLVKYATEIRDGQKIVKDKINEVINR